MGIGIQHIFTTQETRRLKNLIVHTALQTLSGDLFQASLETLIVEVGIGDDVLDYPYYQLCFLATKSLIKSTWQYLSKHQLRLLHDIKTPPLREGDLPLMRIFYEAGVREGDLLAINRCRIYKKIYYLSDITADGTQVIQSLLHGHSREPLNGFEWPAQGNPSAREWAIWKEALQRYIIGRHNTLRHHLGAWYETQVEAAWYYCQEDDRLYHRHATEWQWFRHIPT
jgi:hypothetical protein